MYVLNVAAEDYCFETFVYYVVQYLNVNLTN